MPLRAVVVVAIVTSVLTAAFVHALANDNNQIYACVSNSNGTVRIVAAGTACDERKERPLTWAITGPVGPQGSAGPAGPQGEPGRGALKVVDSLDREVGLLFGQQPIYIKLNDVWQLLQGVGGDRFLEDNQLNLVFLTADCTGQAYVAIGDNLVPRITIYDGVIYSVANPRARIQTNSLRRTEPTDTQCVPYQDNIVAAPAVPIPLSSLGFVLPLHVVD